MLLDRLRLVDNTPDLAHTQHNSSKEMGMSMSTDRQLFYHGLQGISHSFGALTTPNVIGFELALNEAERRSMPLNKFAYCLATVWWETGKTMGFVKEANYVYPHDSVKLERFLRSHKPSSRYYPYYGRSWPQWTWERNYKLATRMWNQRYRGNGPTVDFVHRPDDILDPKYGVPLFFDGMEEGWFTGKSEADYIDDVDESDEEDLREYMNARRVVNGTDKKAEIGRLALIFEHALRSANYGME